MEESKLYHSNWKFILYNISVEPIQATTYQNLVPYVPFYP